MTFWVITLTIAAGIIWLVYPFFVVGKGRHFTAELKRAFNVYASPAEKPKESQAPNYVAFYLMEHILKKLIEEEIVREYFSSNDLPTPKNLVNIRYYIDGWSTVQFIEDPHYSVKRLTCYALENKELYKHLIKKLNELKNPDPKPVQALTLKAIFEDIGQSIATPNTAENLKHVKD